MKYLKFSVPILVLLVLLSFTLIASGETKSKKQTSLSESARLKKIDWVSYDTGLKKAQEENKHVFIDFTTKWCGYCKKMEREAFSDSTVIDLLNNDFIPVRVDGDSKNELDVNGYKVTEKNLTRLEYRVRGYPTFWFLKPDGTKLTNLRGYRPTDYMISALTYVKDYKYDSTKTEDTEEKKKD